MKIRRTIAGILSVAMLLTGCGTGASDSKTESTAETTTTTTAATTTTTEATTTTAEETTTTTEITTEAADENTDATTEDGGMQPETPTSDDELAEVQATIDGFLEANENRDYAAMIQYFDLDLLYYMQTGKMATEAELIQFMEEQEAAGEGEIFADLSSAEIGEAECYNSSAKELNDFLASDLMKETEAQDGSGVKLDMAANFKIDGMYGFTVKNEVSEDGMDLSADIGYSVLRINGEWKVDIALTMVWAFAQMFEGMEDMGE